MEKRQQRFMAKVTNQKFESHAWEEKKEWSWRDINNPDVFISGAERKAARAAERKAKREAEEERLLAEEEKKQLAAMVSTNPSFGMF
jgi:septal ring factor EnvC (AmiA/AmiB activator)